MAVVAVVSSTAEGANGRSTESPSIDMPSGVGDRIYAFVASEDGTVSTPTGWTLETSQIEFNDPGLWIFSIAEADAPASQVWTNTASARWGIICVLVAHADGVETDVFATDNSNNEEVSSGTCPSVTTTADDALILRVAVQAHGSKIPTLSTATEIDSTSGRGTVVGEEDQAVAGSTGTEGFTLSGSSLWASGTIAIKPAGGASGVEVVLTPATATLTPQALGLSLGAATTELAAATASLAAQVLGVSLGAATVELTPVTMTLAPQSLGVSLGALSAPLSPATASLVAQALDVDIAGVPVEVELAPATASLVAQVLGVTTDPLSVALAPATATLTPQALEVSLGAKTVELSPATASLVAQALGVEVSGAPVSVALVPATLASSAQALGVSLTPLDVELTPATLSVAAQALGVSVTALDVELVAAEMTLVAQALGVDIVGGEDPFEALRAAQINMIGPW